MKTTLPSYQSGYTRILKLKLICLLLAVFQLSYGQTDPSKGNHSPGGTLETVKDNYGNSYTLDQLEAGASHFNARGSEVKSLMLCTSGYFDLYFETGSGMEGSSTTEMERRAVICQVFSDISDFINSPLTSTGEKVNIWVRDIAAIEPSPSSSTVLGLATPFYNIPMNITPGFGGIADNEMWKTIHSGTDSYTNVASPLSTIGGSSGSFYHGMVAINFYNTAFTWNTDLSIPSALGGDKDLYSILLHEVTHALGFASLIDYNGQAKFGTGYNYYSRYDLFLRDHTNTQPLITNTGACSLYNYQYNPLITTAEVTPGGCTSTGSADATSCTTAATYSGAVTVPVYTPNCFEPPSSLSHFEDQCYPTPGSPYGNNQYFVMSNAAGGLTKRSLKPEERSVLCDLGYNVNTTFGSTVNNNYVDYGGSACAGINVAGINDGITGSGTYAFTGAPSTNINITGILNNDYFGTPGVPVTAGFECLEDVNYGTAPLSVTSGTGATTIVFNSSVGGLHLLRYVPVNSGVRGNITYIYVYVTNTDCEPSACNIVNNGGYEDNTGCGFYMTGVGCWDHLCATPDILTRVCTAGPFYTIPSAAPNPDTYSGIPNNAYVGVGGARTGGNYISEGIQTQLNSALIPGQSYVLSFWARTKFGSMVPFLSSVIQFTSLPSLTVPITGIITSPVTSMIPGAVDLAPAVVVPRDGIWHYYSVPFTFTGSAAQSQLAIWHNPLGYSNPSFSIYCYLDDISIQPAASASSLALPGLLCTGQTIPDLSLYLSPAPAGGVFSGPGVTLSGSTYSFSATTAGTGTHTITYTFTDALGCTTVIADEITVSGSSLIVTASASPSTVCSGGNTILTASGASTYTWSPGGLSGSPVTISPTSTTTYTVTGSGVSGCAGTATATVLVTVSSPTVTLTASQYTVCAGQSVIITPSGATTYTLNPGGLTSSGTAFTVNPSGTTTYTVTGTSSGCTASASVTINTTPSPTVTLTASQYTVCAGQTVTITPSGATTYTLNPGGLTSSGGPFTVNPSVTTTYTVTATSGSCTAFASVTINILDSSPTITLSASQYTVCAGQHVTITPSGAITYTLNPGGLTSSGAAFTVTPSGTTTYTVTGTAGGGCTASASVTINTTAPPTVTLTASQYTVCASQTVTITPSGATTYTLNPGGLTSSGAPFTVTPSGTTTYTVTGISGSCTATASVTINTVACVCTTCTLIGAGGTMSTTSLPSGVYCINNDVTITGNVSVSASEIKMAPGKTITIAPTGNLNLSTSHIYSCSDMWQGIVVQNGGKFSALGSLIEDAVVAVDITNNTQTTTVMTLRSSTFNRNKVAVKITNYTQSIASYPFTINSCVFTCRNIPFTVNSTVFPSAATIGAPATNPLAPLDNPFINNSTYPQTGAGSTLKAPYAGNKPDAGMRLQNVGVTLNAGTISPTYYEFKLGQSGTINIFDNLTTCVDLLNSNFTTVNNVYQNTVPAISAPASTGTGIYAVSTPSYNNRLQVLSGSTTTDPNRFVDCNRAINTLSYFEHNISYTDFRSSQINTAPTSVANQRGEYGVYMKTNRFRVCNVSNNSLYNLENGIVFLGDFGSYNVSGTTVTGQYAGVVNLDYNTIRPHLPSYSVTTQYVANAIAAQNIIGTGLAFAAGLTPQIQAANNSITNVYRGINYANWKNQNTVINNNSITLVNDPYGSALVQYGINEDNCWAYSTSGNAIRNNSITGFGISNINKKGISSNICSKAVVSCNTTNNIYNGIEFKGVNTPCAFNKNSMLNNQYGYVLSTSGIIGPQGVASPPAPQDNEWQGSWPAGKYKTATLGSFAAPSPLYLRTTGTSVYNPNGSGWTTGTMGTDNYHIGGTSPSLFGVTGTPPAVVSCLTFTAVPGTGGGGTVSSLVSVLEAIAQNTIGHPTYPTESAIIDQNYLYRLLKDEPSLMTSSPVLQAFFTTSQSTNRETFDKIEQKLTNDDLAGAISLQTGITPVNNIETNYKEFYRLAIRNAQSALQSSDMQSLLQLANKCPFTDGVVVYQARALVNAYTQSYQLFEDNCKSEGEERRLKNDSEAARSGDTKFDAVLFPNPGAVNFSLATFGIIEGKLELTVTDINGKVVYQQAHELANALTKFDLDATDGVYFVKIMNIATKESLIKKLVIQK